MDRLLDLVPSGLLVDTAFVLVLLLYPLWRIFSRAGIKPTASLLVLVPYVGGLMVLLLLALLDWPRTKKAAPEEAVQ